MARILFLVFSLLATACLKAQHTESKAIIFDTDMGPDYDDVGAIALLHAFADSGKAEILATIASTKYEGVAAVINVLNTYFKKPDIPIGVPKGEAVIQKDWQHWTDTLLAKYPHKIKSNQEVPNAMVLYRKILAQQPDTSVTIITVGFLTNLSNLLKSGSDGFSSLSGKELVRKKVKQLVSMAGAFPGGKEFNIEEDAKAAKYAFENWPTPVLFSGFEIGKKIKTGLPLIHNEGIQSSPVKDVFRICIPMAKEDSAGRMSWDQTAVLVGVAGLHPFYKTRSGTIKIESDGSNAWQNEGAVQQYLVEEEPAAEVQHFIDKLMMHQPVPQ